MDTHTTTEAYRPNHVKKRWYQQLYFWVLLAIIIGVLVGWLAPSAGVAMEPIGTTFVTAMKMLIGPIVFLTIVGGIASVADLKKVGVTGLKALTYFQVGTILAMIFGLVAINVFRVGDGVNANPGAIETSESASKLIEAGETKQWWEFITHLVPESMVSPFVEGDILQIIFLAVIFGVALNAVGHIGGPVLDMINRLTQIIFKILNYIMKLAPLGAFGAMAYAIGKYGVSTLTSLGSLIALFYVTSALFVFLVLGSVMAYLRLNIWHMLKYLREELLLILGTSTAEPALPGLMRKMEYAGVSKTHCRPCRSDRLQLQPRRRRDLPVPGRAVYRPGDQYQSHHRTATRSPRGDAADLQRCSRSRRRRVHRSDSHFEHDRAHPRGRHHADLRHRQVHVRVPGPGQLHRQRGGHALRRKVEQRARRSTGPCRVRRQGRRAAVRPQRGPGREPV